MTPEKLAELEKLEAAATPEDVLVSVALDALRRIEKGGK